MHDLMVHFDSQAKIQHHVERGALSKEEAEGGSIELNKEEAAKKGKGGPKRRSGGKK